MKNKKSLLTGMVSLSCMLVLLICAFQVGSVYATTGCFTDTNGHWAETFICWMKDNQITSGIGGGRYGPEEVVTRAQMAVFMKKLAEIPPSTGQILISGNTYDWMHPNQLAPLTEDYGINTVLFTRSSTGYNFLRIIPQIPAALYGRSLQLVGVEVCYSASANATLSDLSVYGQAQSTSPFNTYDTLLTDYTARTDTACRYYALTSPYTLSSEEAGIILQLGVNWTVAGTTFTAGRATFVFVPTTTLAAAPSAPQPAGQDALPPALSGGPEDIRP